MEYSSRISYLKVTHGFEEYPRETVPPHKFETSHIDVVNRRAWLLVKKLSNLVGRHRGEEKVHLK